MSASQNDSGSLPFLSPEWLASAVSAGDALGFGTHFPDMQAEWWDRIVWNVGQTMIHRGVEMPPEWERALSQQAGRTDSATLAQGLADAKLAERDEVFSREDNA